MQMGLFRANDGRRRWVAVLCAAVPLVVLAVAGPRRAVVTFAEGELGGEAVPTATLVVARAVQLVGGESVEIDTEGDDEHAATVRSSRSTALGSAATAPAPPMPRLIVPSLDRDRSSFSLDSLGDGLEAPSLGRDGLEPSSWGWLADDYFSDEAAAMPATPAASAWGMPDRDLGGRADLLQGVDPFQQPGLSSGRDSRDWMKR